VTAPPIRGKPICNQTGAWRFTATEGTYSTGTGWPGPAPSIDSCLEAPITSRTRNKLQCTDLLAPHFLEDHLPGTAPTAESSGTDIPYGSTPGALHGGAGDSFCGPSASRAYTRGPTTSGCEP